MSRNYKFSDQDHPYFISFAVVDWIDLFIRNEYRDIMLDSWRHCPLSRENDGLTRAQKLLVVWKRNLPSPARMTG